MSARIGLHEYIGTSHVHRIIPDRMIELAKIDVVECERREAEKLMAAERDKIKQKVGFDRVMFGATTWTEGVPHIFSGNTNYTLSMKVFQRIDAKDTPLDGADTSTLVETLVKREGVTEHVIDTPEHICRIQVIETHGDSAEWRTIGSLTGPARILVVTD